MSSQFDDLEKRVRALSREEKAALAQRYRAGGMGYGEAKKLLLEKINSQFEPARHAQGEA